MIRWLPTPALVLALLACAPAAAQDAPTPPSATQTAEARRLFEQGLELADQERWGEAVESFRASRALVERSSTVFNLANALYRVGRMLEAIATFEDFLRIADRRRDATRVTEANRLLPIARSTLATLVVEVEPADAVVTIDDQPLEGSSARREVQLDPGRHELQARAEGHQPYSSPVTLSGGARTELAIHLAGVAPPPPPPPAPARLVVLTTPPHATVRVDGEALEPGEEGRQLTPGDHVLDVAAPGYRRHHRVVTLVEGTTETVEVRLARAGDVRERSSSSIFASPVFWVVTGAVVVGAGVTLGVAAASGGGTADPYRGTTGVVLR